LLVAAAVFRLLRLVRCVVRSSQLMHPDREEVGEDLFYTSVRYHPSVNDGRGAAPVVVALDTHGKVALWPGAYESREPVELACAEEAVFTAIAISPDGTTIAAATSEGMVVVWSAGAAGFAVAKQWKAHSASVFSLSFGPASASVSMISVTSSGEMKVWDPSWNCRQTVSFKADTYDRVATTCANEVLFLASSKSPSLVACHVGKSGLLDHAAKCNIGQPVLSFTAETDADSVGVFGVQTSAIQQFTIATENCLPPPGLVPEPAPAPAPVPAPTPQASSADGLLSPSMVKGPTAQPAAAPAPVPASGLESAEIAAAMAKLASGIDNTHQQVGQAMAAVSQRVDAGFQQLIAAQAKQQAKQQAEREQQNAVLKQQILEGIAPVIRKELKSALPPLLKNSMQEVASQVILPAIQQSARDSTKGMAVDLQGPMQDSFRAGIISSVLPALEGAIQQAFTTVNDTLEQGLTTCLKEPVEASLQEMQATVQNIASSTAQFQSAQSGSTEGEAPVPAPDPKVVIDSLLQVGLFSAWIMSKFHWVESFFNVQCSMFNVQCSMFNVQCSMFNVQCSICCV
jgi:hypothetical protein